MPANPNKWLVALTVMFGSFMAVMDISVVNVALPQMMGSFGASLSEITWVATAYSIAEILMVTMAAWWSTLLGRKRLYLGSFALFTAGSILCGTATSFTQMIIYRVIQGIGGGALIPVSQAILRESFPPEEQGTAMAVNGMGIVLAPAIGPVFGGYLTDHFGWPWIFYINVPISILGMLMVSVFVFDPGYLKRGVKRIDWGGICLLMVGMTVLQLVLERGEQEDWFESNFIVAGSILGAVSLIGLVFWELWVEEPIINLRLFRNVGLTVGSSIGFVFGIALFGTTFFLPTFTQRMLGYSAMDAGLVLLPRAIALFLMMPVAGALFKRIDSRVMILIGLVLVMYSSWLLGHATLDFGFWDLAPPMIVMGLGMPMIFVTMSTVALGTIPRPEMTQASGLYELTRRIGGNLAYALVATIVAHGTQAHRAELVEYVNPLNGNYTGYTAAATNALAGVPPGAASQAALQLVNNTVDTQATLLAYNDVALITGALFIFAIPLVFLLPKRKKPAPIRVVDVPPAAPPAAPPRPQAQAA